MTDPVAPPQPAARPPRGPRRPPWNLVLVLLGFTLLLGAGGACAYWYLRDSIRHETERTLAVIAEQKRQQIDELHGRVRHDAELFFAGQAPIAAMIVRWLDGGREDAALSAKIRQRLGEIARLQAWGGVALLDREGRVLCVVGEADSAEHAAMVQEVLRRPRIEFVDLHRNARGEAEYGVLAPLGAPGAPPLGLAYVSMRAAQTLFPLVGSWPVPTRTAETFLVRREDQQVRALTPLRHQPDAALTLTMPVDARDLPAAMAARGQRGLLHGGLDYRGVPVLAYVTAIGGTPWLMIAKIDRAEADAEIRAAAWLMALIVGLGLLLVYGAGYLLWRRDIGRRELAARRREQIIEQEKEHTLRLLYAIADGSTDAIFAKDAQGRYLFFNQAAARLTGKTAPTVLGRDDTFVFPAEHAARVMADDRRVMDEDRVLTTQVNVAMVGGERVMLATKGPLHDAAGRVIGLFGISRDITDRKRVEDELRSSKERLEAMVEAMPDLMFKVDRDGRYLEFYSSDHGQLYVSPDAFIGKSVSEVLPEAAARVFMSALEEAAARGGHRGAFYSLPMPQGETWFELSIAPMGGPAGLGEQFIVLVRDLTQRRQMEERLRTSEVRHRLIADNATDVIWTMGLDGRFTYVSPSVERLRGYTPTEVMQQSMAEALTPASLVIAQAGMQQSLAAVEAGLPVGTFRGELEQPCKDGSTVWTEATVSAIQDSAGRFVELLGITRDITERRRYELELREAHAAAEAANAAKGEFLAHMSHEIRTPLNVVLGLAQVLGREPLAANQRDMVARIRTAGQSLLGILNDILDLSKIEAGQLRIEPRPFAPGVLLVKLADLLGPAAAAKGLVLRIGALPLAVGPLVGDALRLEQVLVNLIGNAIKFTEQGEVAVEARPLPAGEGAQGLRFEVCDTGIGISPEAQRRLFTPFTQADTGITRRFGGTGLGLSICKRLVELMGGTIGVESRPARGSRFWFELTFPKAAGAAPGTTNAAPRAPVRPQVPGERLAGAHLLVVDDSAMNRDLAERALALEGATVTLAVDGQEAVQIIGRRPADFDAVLMDVRMPVMDGLHATRLIRGQAGLVDLPIIALTAGVLEEERKAALAAGVNDILTKPLDIEQMTCCLLRWIGPRTVAAPGGSAPGRPPAVLTDAEPPFPEIAGIDGPRVAAALSGNRTLFLRLLQGFTEEFAEVVERMRADLAAGEREAAARRAHSLRGNSGTLGALGLMARAGALEEAIGRGETDLEERLAALGEMLDALITASAPWRSTAVAERAPACEGAPLAAGQFDALREALLDHRLDALHRLSELQPQLTGAFGRASSERIAAAIRALRFTEALALLDQAAAVSAAEPKAGREPAPGLRQY